MNVKFKRIDPTLPMLTQAYPHDACFDLYVRNSVVIPPFSGVHVDFGVALELPDDSEALIRSRSGWSRKGVYVIHGTIDSGYRGEVGCHVFNSSGNVVTLERGTKIAQLAVRPIPKVVFTEVEELPKSERGAAGFGSSGM